MQVGRRDRCTHTREVETKAGSKNGRAVCMVPEAVRRGADSDSASAPASLNPARRSRSVALMWVNEACEGRMAKGKG